MAPARPAALAALLLTVTTLLVAAPATARADDAPIVVGLGDSVAAGYAAGPTATSPYAGPCARSTAAYPVKLAADAFVLDADLACSGATAAVGVLSPQGAVPSQLSQLRELGRPPLLVTLTVGANDVGWSGVLATCFLSACDTDANTEQFTRRLDAAARSVDEVLTAVDEVAPEQVAVTGYYDPLGALARPVYGLTAGEVTWYRARLAQLDDRLRALADDHDARFVDLSPLTATADPTTTDVVQGVTTRGFGHPTAKGQARIAALVEKAVDQGS